MKTKTEQKSDWTTLGPYIAHIDDEDSLSVLFETLGALHGARYDFAVMRWAGETTVSPSPGRTRYCFVVESQDAAVALAPGEQVRGVPEEGPYHSVGKGLAKTTAAYLESLWPGDVLVVDEGKGAVTVTGSGTFFQVLAESTDYPAPRLALLRHLPDKPGGCAAYSDAFRREALPPQRPSQQVADQRGVNRVNEHTLDMRYDRDPHPIRHHHGPVAVGEGQVVNHSETAIVLPRSVYGLPEVDTPDAGHIVIYRRPQEEATDTVTVPVRPGSIVVTPAAEDVVYGHCFENAFAMLIAIPGFVAPYHMLDGS